MKSSVRSGLKFLDSWCPGALVLTRVFLLMGVALLLAEPAGAELPVPAFPECGLGGDLQGCPNEAAGDWKLWGHTPDQVLDTLRPQEVELGIGNNATGAWRHGSGRWDQVIVVADGGIVWRTEDLINKVMLNVAELPLPRDQAGVEALVHDRDGNGLVNVVDYAVDPRVSVDAGDDRADGVLDPSDLIAVFSDGVDDDGNGYVDDIAGWDFFERDNDPGATNEDNYGDHGNGVARIAAAEANNGGRVGVCPNCAILPVRIGDAFIATGDILAEAAAFAIAHQAASMTLAVGGILTPDWLGEIFAQAWDSELMIVAAAGDETSYHRNFPAVDPHALFVHSIGVDSDDWEDGQSFLRFVNCNNFGPRMDLVSVTKNTCATGSVAFIAGAAALVQSVAVEHLGSRLSSAQLYRVLTQTATDVDVAESRGEQADPELFPSYPGWDQNFGFGRVDVGAAVEEVVAMASQQPPAARITAPGWFEFLVRRAYDEQGRASGSVDRVVVSGEIEAAPDQSWNYRLEWGVGSDVAEEDWRLLAEVQGEGAFSGDLGSLAVGEVPVSDEFSSGCTGATFPEPFDPLQESGFDPSYLAPELAADDGILGRVAKFDPYGITFRLSLTDEQGRSSELRRHVYVREDPGLLPGFPVSLPGSVESSPVLVDLTGDGNWEIVLATGDGTVHAMDGHGEPLPGWPVQVGLHPGADPSRDDNHLGSVGMMGELSREARQALLAGPAAGALEGQGLADVVAATVDGELYAWRADGSLREGFPVHMNYENCAVELRDEEHRYDCGFGAAPTLVDMDGDGDLEILQPGMDQWLYLWDHQGQPVPGWPVKVQDPSFEAIANREGRILSSPAVGDIDGDGGMEIVIGTGQTAGSDFGGYGVLYALDEDGSLLEGWPITLFAGFAGALPVIGEGIVVQPALADVDGDGDLEIGANATADQGGLYHHDGSVAVDFAATRQDYGPYATTEEQAMLLMLSSGAFGDADGDGSPDYFAGASSLGYGANILAWTSLFDHDHALVGYSGRADEEGRGKPLAGYPRQLEDLPLFSATSAADLDGDGMAEAIHASTFVTRAWNGDGEPMEGFPMFHGGWVLGGTAVGDVDGDGYREVVFASREGNLFAFRTVGSAAFSGEWLMTGHDAQRTGNYHHPVPLQSGPQEDGSEQACAQAGPVAPRGLVLLLVAVLGVLRRRRL